MSKKLLTVGMATYDDFDGVYMTLQSLQLYHGDALRQCELLVLDNHPGGPHHRMLKTGVKGKPGLIQQVGGTLLEVKDKVGTSCRDLLFQHATTPFVLCLDCHVMLAPGSLTKLLAYLQQHPRTDDLLQGPLLSDRRRADGQMGLIATHMTPDWGPWMWGRWAIDRRGTQPDAQPFEIPMHGLGLFCARRESWLGFNPHFKGFGGEEGYIHTKYRQAGRRTLCLPFLRWLHRFYRIGGAPYPNRTEDRAWNYLLGFTELGLDLAEVAQRFKPRLPAGRYERLREQAQDVIRRGKPPKPVQVVVGYRPPRPKQPPHPDEDPAYWLWHGPAEDAAAADPPPPPKVVEEPAPELPAAQPRRPVVILGVGHSGTTVLVRQLLALGWQSPPLDEFAEPPEIRQLNQRLIRARKQSPGLAQAQLQQDLSQQLSSLPAGYVLKDPRFVLTLDAWWDQLFAHVPEAQRPLLVWIRRNFAEVAQSYRRRNYYIQRDGQQVLGLYGLTLAELHAQAAQQYLRWPGEKLILDFKQLENAHRLFNLGKSARSRIELHRAKEAPHG